MTSVASAAAVNAARILMPGLPAQPGHDRHELHVLPVEQGMVVAEIDKQQRAAIDREIDAEAEVETGAGVGALAHDRFARNPAAVDPAPPRVPYRGHVGLGVGVELDAALVVADAAGDPGDRARASLETEDGVERDR